MTDIFKNATLMTERLRLVPFALPHAPALNAINREPHVMAFLGNGAEETLAQTQDSIIKIRDRWNRFHFGWWTLFSRATDRIVGAACLQHVANDPAAELEIGWRLTATARGKGFATQAGRAAATYAFDTIGADHVIAVADPKNIASHRVMARLGMRQRGIETHYNRACITYVLQATAKAVT